ncbi:MAG: ATP-binding protein [Bacillota bacterium]|jgi:DNA replication protein DnaC
MEKINPRGFWSHKPQEENYQCPLCRDTGWRIIDDQAAACSCRNEQLLAKRKAKAGLSAALLEKTFATFKLQYYPEYLKVEQGASYRVLANKALNAAKDFVACQIAGKTSRGLLFEGDVGRGKTFLAAAIANKLLENDVDTLFLVVPEFLEQLRYTYQNDSQSNESQLMNKAANVPVLILDDLGAHNFSDWTKNKIFTLINYRLNHQLPCVITSNLSIDQLNNVIDSRTVSRIMEICDVYRLHCDMDLRMKNQD